MKKNNKKGFTLAELLIVVAIIAVLVAIAIPIFSAQLEKSKEATDIANVRSAAATVAATWLADGKYGTDNQAVVTAKQSKPGWEDASKPGTIVMQINGTESTQSFNASTTSYTVSIDANGVISVTAA